VDSGKFQAACAAVPVGLGMGIGDPSARNSSPAGFGIGMGEPSDQLLLSPSEPPLTAA